MKAYLQELNEVQRKAVLHTDGPVLVIAGPGSGKTRVLTYRIAHLIEEGVAPWEILSLTFTNKAAREMKERISKVVGNKANQVWAGTFHSIFARILRVEAEKLGYPSNFTIYDTEDSKNVLAAIIKSMGLDKGVYVANAIRNRISSAKSNLITPKAYREDTELMTQDRASKRPQMHNIYEQYVKRCRKAGAMDFDDLLFQLFRLLYQNPDNVLQKYQDRFKYLLVDEFQDTNFLQYSIVRKLVDYRTGNGEVDHSRLRNICVVGDDAQSIYAFRGATIENILDFEKDFKRYNIGIYKLEQNYRSTDHIVQAANEVITNNQKQIPKEIWSDKGSGHRIKVIKTVTDSEEGKRVADTILEQKNRYHLHNSDFAILYRTNSQSRVFEESLRRYNILYKVYGGLSFYQRKEVKDLIAYLRLIVNPIDEEALRRVINYPKRGIGNTSVDKINQLAVSSGITMWEAMSQTPLSKRAMNSLADFKKMIAVFKRKSAGANAYELATLVARQSGIIDLLKKDNSVEGMGRMENINGLLDSIKEFVENDEIIDEATLPDKTLSSYLQNIALHTALDNEEDDGEYVTLMSVHSAKGLEFKSVFVVGLEEKLFPSFMSMESAEQLDEERRLFYVAITRAEQFLTLTFANSRYQFGQMRYNDASRFLQEISPKHLETANPISNRSLTEKRNSAPVNSGIKGNFKRSRPTAPVLRVDPATFKPSPSQMIQEGMKVLHMKFGEGRIVKIDGAVQSRVATIFFEGIDDPERRIMLKFAKLQIL